MCQQWFSVAGLVLDVVGFLLIAWEWHHMFLLHNREMQNKVEEGYARSSADALGEQYEDPHALDHTMWRHFQRAGIYHSRYRAKFFYGGAGLVILGFLGQSLGSWPGGVPFFGFKSC